jgi:hypothetical protein
VLIVSVGGGCAPLDSVVVSSVDVTSAWVCGDCPLSTLAWLIVSAPMFVLFLKNQISQQNYSFYALRFWTKNHKISGCSNFNLHFFFISIIHYWLRLTRLFSFLSFCLQKWMKIWECCACTQMYWPLEKVKID